MARIYHDRRSLSVSSVLEAAMPPNTREEVLLAHESRFRE